MKTLEKTGGNKFLAFLKRAVRNQIFIPLAALLILVLFNLIADPSFFAIKYAPNSAGDMVISGNIITILDNASELAILAIGMTLVTSASGGQDISVGATIAVAGSVVLRVLCGGEVSPAALHAPIIVAFLACVVVSMLLGAFNGALVAYFKIQPMVATLILFTAGRSIAAWINNNQLPVINDESFGWFGNFIPGLPLPTPIFIAAICIIIIALVLRFTKLGLFTQAVGINSESSRLNGLNPARIKYDVGHELDARRVHQGQPYLLHQLLGSCKGHRDGRYPCGSTRRKRPQRRQVQHGVLDTRRLCYPVPDDNSL